MKIICTMTAEKFAKVSVVEITKDDAKRFLENNSKNRGLSKKNVALLKNAMNDRKWLFNGDTIVLDGDGFLKSGQHRLSAFIESNLETLTIILVHLFSRNDVLRTLNKGLKMNIWQYFKIKGVSHYKDAASVARLFYRCANGVRLEDGSSTEDYKIEEFYNQNVEKIDRVTSLMARHSTWSIGIVAATAFVFAAHIRPDLSDKINETLTNVSQCVAPRGSIESVVLRLNGVYRGKCGTNIIAGNLKRMLYVVGWYFGKGIVKERAIEMSVDDFVKTMKGENSK